jgi:hypothetical protein
VSADHMVATFLAAEIDSPWNGHFVNGHLESLGQTRRLVDHPNVDDPAENAVRRRVLSGTRGYPASSQPSRVPDREATLGFRPLKYPVPRYSFLAFQLTTLLDQGESMTVEEARTRIHDGSLFDRLEELRADVSPYDASERRAILSVFEDLSDNADFAETRNGIALCLAFCIEVMQHPKAYADVRFSE